MFFLKVAATTLALVAPLVSALSINPPAEWNSGGSVTITWTAQAGDPQSFSIELQNPSFNSQFALANNVPTGQMSITLTLPIVPEDSNYVLQFVDIGDINSVFASTSSFAIGATVSSSTDSSASSSSGSSTASASASASTTNSSASASTSSSRSNVASTTGSGSSTAASSTASTFDSDSGAAAIAVSRSSLAGYAVMAGAALAGAGLVGF